MSAISNIIGLLNKGKAYSKAWIQQTNDRDLATIGYIRKLAEAVNEEFNGLDQRPYKVYSALATFTTNEVSPGGFDYSLTVLENTFTETVTSAQTIGGNLEFSIPNTDATKGVAFVVSQSAVAFTVFPVTYVYDSSGTAVASFEVTAEMADSGTRYLEFRVYN